MWITDCLLEGNITGVTDVRCKKTSAGKINAWSRHIAALRYLLLVVIFKV
jgi:hypothetical protein